MVQKVMVRTLSPAKEMISDMTLEANMEKITPMRIMLFVDRERSST